MRRWVFNILAGVSLLVGVAVGVMWVRSYLALDSLEHHTGSVRIHVAFAAGDLYIARSGFPIPPAGRFRWSFRSGPARRMELRAQDITQRDIRFAGARLIIDAATTGAPPWTQQMMLVPFWMIFVCFAVLPGWWVFLRMRERRKMRPGVCAVCGYDLRATPGRCPECGEVPAPSAVVGEVKV